MSSAGQAEHLSQVRKAIADLYESHFDRIARYIYRRIGDPTEAEDMAGETFLRAVRSADTFTDTGAPLEAWLFRIARNLTVDFHRRRSSRPQQTELDKAESVTDERGKPDENIELEEQKDQLQMAIQQLSEAQQEVIALRFSDSEMTSAEVAEVLGRSPGAVREMQSAAIKRLRLILEPMDNT